ncbi:MAG: hypothetical protein RL308_2296, partial [Bacteroidota bacterium]
IRLGNFMRLYLTKVNEKTDKWKNALIYGEYILNI